MAFGGAHPGSFVFRGESENVLSLMSVNGVPIAHDSIGSGVRKAGMINEWARRGKNTLRLDVNWPPELPFVERLAHAHVSLGHLGPGNQGEPEQLAQLQWPAKQRKEGYPDSLRAEFLVSRFPELSLWSSSIIEEIDLQERRQIIIRVKSLYDAYVRRDVDTVMQLLALRTREYAIAYGDSIEERTESIRGFTQRLVDAKKWGLKPLNTDTIALQVVAEGHAVLISKGDGQPVIQSVEDCEFQWSNPLYVCKIENQWEFIR